MLRRRKGTAQATQLPHPGLVHVPVSTLECLRMLRGFHKVSSRAWLVMLVLRTGTALPAVLIRKGQDRAAVSSATVSPIQSQM